MYFAEVFIPAISLNIVIVFKIQHHFPCNHFSKTFTCCYEFCEECFEDVMLVCGPIPEMSIKLTKVDAPLLTSPAE